MPIENTHNKSQALWLFSRVKKSIFTNCLLVSLVISTLSHAHSVYWCHPFRRIDIHHTHIIFCLSSLRLFSLIHISQFIVHFDFHLCLPNFLFEIDEISEIIAEKHLETRAQNECMNDETTTGIVGEEEISLSPHL